MRTASKVRFGAFEFDAASAELRRDGRLVHVQRQPARLLALLLASPDALVTREDIRSALWGGETHVDFERSLNFCVAKLRAALKDNAAAPRYIETLPTRGYRFIAPVTRVPSPEPASATSAPLAADHGAATAVRVDPRSGFWLWLAGVTSGVVLVAGLLGSARHPAAPPAAPKVVVVPFHNETGSPDLDRVAKGVSDATVARLASPARLAQLRVIGNAADVRFSFRPPDMKAIGDSLGAQYLILGQMKKDDRRMRIVAHLIRVSDQTHLWANAYDADAFDLPQQSAIAEQIAASVAATLARADRGV